MRIERNRYTTFPEGKERVAPIALYETVYPTIPTPRNEIYFSSPLTSGGAKRLFDKNNITENIPTIVRLNSTFAETVAQESEEVLTAERFTLPHHLGGQGGWKELDFLKFWMNYLSGIAPDHAKEFDKKGPAGVGVDPAIFNDYSLPRERRIEGYERLVDGFVGFIRDTDAPINPVAGIVCLPDHQLSVGCSAETRLAKSLGIPTQEVSFDRDNPRYQKLEKLAPWLANETHSPSRKDSSNGVIIFQAL